MALNKFKDFLEDLDEHELTFMKKELSTGASNLSKLVDVKILKDNESFCATCFREIKEVEKPYTLIFGPHGLKKQASFCAKDCLTYFLENQLIIQR